MLYFLENKIKYLGVIVMKDSIKTDKHKTDAITSVYHHKNCNHVATFLEKVDWYIKFIARFS